MLNQQLECLGIFGIPPLISSDTKVLILILSNILLDMRCRKDIPVAQQLSKRGFAKGGTKPEPCSLLPVLLQRKFIVLNFPQL